MQKGHIGAVVSLAGMVLCWVATARAADAVIGSVLAVRGSVFADSGAGSQALTTNAPLHRGDTVVSSAGKVKIALHDGSIISVAENTRLRLADHENTPGSVKARIKLISGALRLFVARITPTGTFEIETETAIAAVRGTDWVIEATPERTAVAVLRGVVAVTGRAAQAPATVMLRSPGHGTDVRVGSAPTPAKPWGASRLADLLARVAFD
ncbi:MAG: FecR family protein [Casimicrobiaceae bacterium]